jgi:hypothetical protein
VLSRFETPSSWIADDAVQSEARETTTPAARRVDVGARDTEGGTSRSPEPGREQPRRTETHEVKPIDRAVPLKARVEQILKQVETVVKRPPIAPEPQREKIREHGLLATPVVPRIVSAPTTPQSLHGTMVTRPHRSPESEPTVIRVHIGRIDVRTAALAPERPRARPKAVDTPKPMSLDRYLSGKDRA